METLSIIIPIYNEEHTIPALYGQLKNVVSPLKLTYEFMFVSDGGKDSSIALIKQLTSIDVLLSTSTLVESLATRL